MLVSGKGEGWHLDSSFSILKERTRLEMIKLSNGHELEFLAASGSLAFDGRGWPWEWPLRWLGLLDPYLFTIVTKTIMPEPWRGNLRWTHPWDVVKFISEEGKEIHPIKALTNPASIGGVINAIGLTGPGVETWIENDYPKIERSGLKVIVSITRERGQSCRGMVKRLSGLKNVVGIEYNSSCPNVGPILLDSPEIVIRNCCEIKGESDYPVLLKLGYAQPYLEIAMALQGTVEAISINTVPWKTIFGGKISPLAKYGGGGVSGPVAKPIIWKMISELAREISIPVIGAGIWEYEDISRLKSFGASAFQTGTLFLPYPCRPTRYVKRWRQERGG
ncbi:MAG: hypothetical protein V1705_01725 [bacterium]